jgi:hypothetical protein
MMPITGYRYTDGHGHDLCQAAFDELPAVEQRRFERLAVEQRRFERLAVEQRRFERLAVVQRRFERLAVEQRRFERLDPPLTPRRAAVASVASVLLGSQLGALSLRATSSSSGERGEREDEADLWELQPL